MTIREPSRRSSISPMCPASKGCSRSRASSKISMIRFSGKACNSSWMGQTRRSCTKLWRSTSNVRRRKGSAAAKVWEAAGGYAPTVGIIGAVLGLIHVMENLADPSKLGGGIAVAFVATVYGVGAANLFFLPLASKIKFKLKEEAASRTMIIMGLVGLAQGENPAPLAGKARGLSAGISTNERREKVKREAIS